METVTSDTRRKLLRTVAGIAKTDPEGIDPAKPLLDCFLDSLSLLILRETCERLFGLYIPDSDWVSLQSLDELSRYIARETQKAYPEASAPVVSRDQNGWSPDDLSEELEIGMPLTGISHLAESPLLKYLGDLRWRHLSKLTGVPSKQIVDADGNRLYATFFYVEVAFPEAEPMASKMENDRVRVISRMARFGGSMLDGITYLLPVGAPRPSQGALESMPSAASAGIPAVRLSNIFVRQFSGAEWLKKSRPANPGFEAIREVAIAPDSYTAVKTAEKEGHLGLPDSTFVPMTEAEVSMDYKLIPERDVNGVGLVYFANYPIFLDICERQALLSAELPLSDEYCNRRTITRRRSAYLNNASWKDSVTVQTRVWVQNPIAAQHKAPEMAPVRLFSNQRMYRTSDSRLMMVSTSEKLIFGAAMEGMPFFEKLVRAF